MRKKNIARKVGIREKADKIGEIFTVCQRDFFYLYVKLARA